MLTGWAPSDQRTIALEITDLHRRLSYDAPNPGPVTTIRGTASELLLALWRRQVRFQVDGDSQ